MEMEITEFPKNCLCLNKSLEKHLQTILLCHAKIVAPENCFLLAAPWDLRLDSSESLPTKHTKI